MSPRAYWWQKSMWGSRFREGVWSVKPAGLALAPSAPVWGRSQGPSALGTEGQGRAGVQSIRAGGASPCALGDNCHCDPRPKVGLRSSQEVPEPWASAPYHTVCTVRVAHGPNSGCCPGQLVAPFRQNGGDESWP